jgi:peroxiredoxin
VRHVFFRPLPTFGFACLALLAALALSPAGAASAQEDEAPAAAAPKPASATISVGEKLPADLILRGKAGDEEGVPRARVYVFWSPRCPVCSRYAPTLSKLMDDFGTKATVALVVSSDGDTDEAVAQALAEQELRLPMLRDTEGRAARRLGVRVSPTAVLVDAGGVLRYRGPIDDDRRARQRDARDHLRPALEAVLTGKTVETSEVRAFGSALRP